MNQFFFSQVFYEFSQISDRRPKGNVNSFDSYTIPLSDIIPLIIGLIHQPPK